MIKWCYPDLGIRSVEGQLTNDQPAFRYPLQEKPEKVERRAEIPSD